MEEARGDAGLTVSERLAHASSRLYDAVRSPHAGEVAEHLSRDRNLDALRGHKNCLVTTYRRSGEAMPTPVWFGVAGGRLYFRTYSDTAKVKRIRNNPRVLVGPCDVRGKPRGPMIDARARLLDATEADVAERAIQSNHGLFRRVYLAGFSGRVPDTYVEVTPT